MESPELVHRLALRLRDGSAEPASQLIVDEVWLAVVEGSLESGQRLPTARQLAIALGVSPRSIERAYLELERRGVVATRQGAGTFISLTQPSEHDLARHQELAKLCREMIARATELGFTIDDMLDALTEYRTAEHESSLKEPGP
jgi:GntR family transcriptional regulator